MSLERIVRRREALQEARDAWKRAPSHVRMMAGAYVEPLLLALGALGEEMDGVQDDLCMVGVARGGADQGADHGA